MPTRHHGNVRNVMLKLDQGARETNRLMKGTNKGGRKGRREI